MLPVDSVRVTENLVDSPSRFIQNYGMHNWGWLRDYWVELANALILLSLGISGQHTVDELSKWRSNGEIRGEAANWWWVLAFIVFILLYVVTWVFVVKRRVRISALQAKVGVLEKQCGQLENKYQEAQKTLPEAVKGTLFNLATVPLEFTHNERITFYLHDGSDSFVAVGRYSKNPEYNKKGRPSYPDDMGTIGKAWRKGYHFCNDFPDPTTAAIRYASRCEREGMPAEVVENLRMKPRLLYGKQISNVRGRALGVVVVESTDPERYSESELNVIFNGSEVSYIVNIAEHLSGFNPDPKIAEQAGL